MNVARTLNTVSLFCGAGGETAGKLAALDDLGIAASSVAMNHWDLAVATHAANFPGVDVRCEDVCSVTAADFGLSGERIDLLWASPSCVHHSRARGGKPRDEQQRAHAWEVVDRWLRVADVRVLLIENVPEFEQWGALDDEGAPIPEERGAEFHRWVQALRDLGYVVGWRVLCAADYGDPTTRKRLFVQARRDGRQIAWPSPTHRNPAKPVDMFTAGLAPWRSAAECIDWSIPVPSIFDRPRPLKPATLRRIAHGVMRYVVNCADPFIVNLTHGGRVESIRDPLTTVTTANRGEKALVAPTLIQTSYGEREGQRPRTLDLHQPLGTRQRSSLLPPFDLPTTSRSVVAGGGKHALVAAFLAKHYGGVVGTRADVPLGAVSAGGIHHGVVAAFLTQYYSGGGTGSRADAPLPAVTTVARHGLVTVTISGETFILADIGMRMLQPRELARAMGFPDSFELPENKTAATRMIGNACPVGTVRALVRAALQSSAREVAA